MISCAFNVQEWLEQLQMGVYASYFLENHIDCHNLLLLKDAELKELGVKIIGHRKLIIREINEFKRKAIRCTIARKRVREPNAPAKESTQPGEGLEESSSSSEDSEHGE